MASQKFVEGYYKRHIDKYRDVFIQINYFLSMLPHSDLTGFG